MSRLLECHNVSLTLSKNEILRDIQFTLTAGSRVAIVGPSGCGKSSLLHMLAGLRIPTAGNIIYNGETVNGPSRDRVLIFQNYALFPWKSAGENVAFALRARGEKLDLREKAQRYLELVGLGGTYDLFPRQLSGGMQQRIGIARALAAQPEVLLLDEPFAALDALTKESVLQDISHLLGTTETSVILVTHNIEEALYMADRILVFSEKPGRILQDVLVPQDKPQQWMDFKHHKNYLDLELQIYNRILSNSGDLA